MTNYLRPQSVALLPPALGVARPTSSQSGWLDRTALTFESREAFAMMACGSQRTTELSRFGSTACKALRRCEDCAEPFEHIKEI